MGEWRCSSTILDLVTRWRLVLKITPPSLYTQYAFDRLGLGAGLDDVENRKILPLPGIETRMYSPFPVAILGYSCYIHFMESVVIISEFC
jgi:hypothetical protein